jgi:hypothetical protein
VLLATGYRVDVALYDFLAPELLKTVRRVDGYPLLGPGFESSLPGLHFLGAPAARSFGPVCRFVSGTPYTARALARRIAGKARRELEPVCMRPTTTFTIGSGPRIAFNQALARAMMRILTTLERGMDNAVQRAKYDFYFCPNITRTGGAAR